MRCFESHTEDARRLMCANSVSATKYKLSPSFREKLIADGKLTIRRDPAPGKWSKRHPRLIVFTEQELADMDHMDREGISGYKIHAHIGRASYPVIHARLQQVRRERREKQSRPGNGAKGEQQKAGHP